MDSPLSVRGLNVLTVWQKICIRVISFLPGDCSTPEATSTPTARNELITCTTLSEFKPPAITQGKQSINFFNSKNAGHSKTERKPEPLGRSNKKVSTFAF